MRPLHQPEPGVHTVRYQPDQQTVLIENPPRFTWMPARPMGDRYCLQIAGAVDFPEDETFTVEPVHGNFYTPDSALAPGTYYWRYCLVENGGARSEWSQIRSFLIPTGLPETPLPGRHARYTSDLPAHPRLWLSPQELSSFREGVLRDPVHCGWQEFYEGSVLPWMSGELVQEPEPYPNNKRVPKLWRKMYMDCQDALHAVRHLAVAAQVTEDPAIIARAKTYLFHVAAWDVEGPTSRDYNDEAAFRIAGALAWGYDWLYDHLTPAERDQVRKPLLERTEQVAYHVMRRAKIHHNPFDSHAVRSVSSVLVPCCIALFGEEPQAREWLDYSLEYYACIYTPWGGADGGWAEGGHYWMTGHAYVTEGLNLVRKFTSIDFYTRPFFQKTGDFPLYCYPVDTVRATFGDQANLGERPGLKVGYNIRQYAGVTGNGHYQWYFEQTRTWDVDAEKKFWNAGWWDFRFDEMCYRHDYPTVEAIAPTDLPEAKWFKDVGWVALHHRMAEPEEHIFLLTKASPFGSLSHSHGDQGAFTLHAYGEPLAIHSGYYVAFNTTMHLNWRRQTLSKNAILIDGQGQYAGMDKIKQVQATGRVEAVETHPTHSYVRMDATAAYQETVPYLTRYTREIYFVGQSYFVVVDQVDLAQKGRVDWLMHSLQPFQIGDQSFRVEGAKADLDVAFVYSSGGFMRLSQTDEFTGVDPAEIEGLPREWHLTASTRESKRHQIVTLMVPVKKGAGKYVDYFLDDQDHGLWLYFTEQQQTFRIELPKGY